MGYAGRPAWTRGTRIASQKRPAAGMRIRLTSRRDQLQNTLHQTAEASGRLPPASPIYGYENSSFAAGFYEGDSRVISGQFSRRLPRALSAAVPLFGALLLCGCGESLRYSPELRYPARTDPIVDEVPKDQPWASEQPGRLDESIAEIPKKGGKVTEPKDIDAGGRAKLLAALNTTFGTPYAPQVGAAKGEDEGVVTQLVQLKVRDANENAPFHTLATGSKEFRYHCVHCHGVPGDGRGPTGPWVVPHPRDYRLGKFKFVSSAGGPPGKPRRDD